MVPKMGKKCRHIVCRDESFHTGHLTLRYRAFLKMGGHH